MSATNIQPAAAAARLDGDISSIFVNPLRVLSSSITAAAKTFRQTYTD